MNIKTFRDGERLVVVFEGLKDMPSEEDMIKSYLSGIIGTQVYNLPDAKVKPIAKPKSELEVFIEKTDVKLSSIKSMADETKVLSDLQKEAAEADSDIYKDFLNRAIKDYLCQRMIKFNETDYAKSLNERQAGQFVSHYGRYINQEELKDIKDVKESVKTIIEILSK